jgi:hypothetical protein
VLRGGERGGVLWGKIGMRSTSEVSRCMVFLATQIAYGCGSSDSVPIVGWIMGTADSDPVRLCAARPLRSYSSISPTSKGACTISIEINFIRFKITSSTKCRYEGKMIMAGPGTCPFCTIWPAALLPGSGSRGGGAIQGQRSSICAINRA